MKNDISFLASITLGSSVDVTTSCEKNMFIKGPLLVVGYVRLDNYTDLCVFFHKKKISHLELILLLWEKWGEKCVEHIYGDFSFIIVNKASREIFGARDHFGVSPFFYSYINETIFFSTSLRRVVNQPNTSWDLCEKWQVNFLNDIPASLDETVYSAIKRLPPASVFHFKQDFQIRTYWQLQHRSQKLSEEEAITGLKEHLHRAIRCRLPEAGKLACELSGGLDSTAITGIAQAYFDQSSMLTYSQVLNDASHKKNLQGDERDRIKLFLEKYDGLHNRFIADNGEGILEETKKFCEILASPFKVDQLMLSQEIYKDAGENQASVLFSGFGGDECVSMQNQWSFYNEYIERRKFLHLLKSLKKSHPKRWPYLFLKKLVSYSFDKKRLTFPQPKNILIKKEFQKNPEVGEIDVKNCFSFSKSLLIDRIHTVERLEESAQAASYFGFNFRYPFFDVRLIEYFLSIPVEYKYKNNVYRYLFRKCLEDVLPKEVLNGNKPPVNVVPSIKDRLKTSLEKKEYFINSLKWLDIQRVDEALKVFYSGSYEYNRCIREPYILSIFLNKSER